LSFGTSVENVALVQVTQITRIINDNQCSIITNYYFIWHFSTVFKKVNNRLTFDIKNSFSCERINNALNFKGKATPGEATPGKATPGEVAPGEATPGEATPGEATPGEATPGEVYSRWSYSRWSYSR
jgi:hypothetical protein